MNDFIRRAAGRGDRPGVLERLRGTSPLGADRQERLNVQMAAYETAARRRDHVAAEIADERIERLLDEARAERVAAAAAARETAEAKAAEQRRAEALSEPPVRGSQSPSGLRRQAAAFSTRPTPGARAETAGQLFNRAMAQSRFERAERGDDERLIRINR